MNMDMDMDMSNDEVDLSALILHNAATDTSPAFRVSSPVQSTIAAFPPVVPRPISKRRGKKRSSRACTTCRLRKVRCNIVAHGAPCSNCRHDEIECVLPLSRRQRAARERAEQSVRNSTVDSDAPSQLMEERCTSVTAHIPPPRSQPLSNLGPHGMSISEHVLSEILPTNAIAPSPSSGDSPQATSSSRTKSWIQVQAPLASAPPSAASSQAEIKLPPLFTPFPQHLDSHDLSYLHSRDALTLPSETLQIALLKAYISFIHPITPILDLEEFLSAVKYGQLDLDGERGKCIEREMDGRKQIPFLLFQAVMLAGVGVVALRVLREEGYLDRERAQKVFFNRVRLLYDFDTTTDRLSIIQSLLLMTLSPYPLTNPSTNTNTSDKDSHHYLGLAISLSFSLGINRHLPASISSNPRRKRLERRIWWTAFVRDRALSLENGFGGGRPIRIKREDCDVEMLSLEDFDLDLSSEEEGEEEMRERMAARECVEKARLCWWSCDYGLVGNYLNMMSNQLQPAWMLQKQMQISIPRSQLQLQFQPHFAQHGRIEEQIYTSSTSSLSSSRPYHQSAEEIEYATTSTTPSVHSDCITPPPSAEYPTVEEVECESPLGAGYGVDGEYDDYLEYLKPAKREMEEGRRDGFTRRYSAIQMDVENGRMIEV